MSDPFKVDQINNRIQAQWLEWQTIVSQMVPAAVRHRKNMAQAILQISTRV